MKAICTTTVFSATLLGAGPALAHIGHLGDVAGHDHWIALGALGAAAGIALWAGLKGRKRPAQEEDEAAESEETAEPQEA